MRKLVSYMFTSIDGFIATPTARPRRRTGVGPDRRRAHAVSQRVLLGLATALLQRGDGFGVDREASRHDRRSPHSSKSRLEEAARVCCFSRKNGTQAVVGFERAVAKVNIVALGNRH
jgi:hypothetical protein